MDIRQTFEDFINNLKVTNSDDISYKYRRITKALNLAFRDTESETTNCLQVGSYGRYTAIDGVSDLDMIYEMPLESFKRYDEREGNSQSGLLQDVRKAILETYSNTDIRGDCQVVVIAFTNYQVEVCPGFIQSDGSYKYPDSKNGGTWKVTKPRQEIDEINNFNRTTNGNLKNLSRMLRAWKNRQGLKIGGLLIDTLCYNFLKENKKHHGTTFADYHLLVRDIFEFLKNTPPEQKYWLALGSNQKVFKKSNFIRSAKKAYDAAVSAIAKNENETVYSIWRRIFGLQFPYPAKLLEASSNYTNSEEFIENVVPVDIRYNLNIECNVSQAGFRDQLLSQLPFVKTDKKLLFYIKSTDTPRPYSVKWKVKNKGDLARRRNMLRGQLLDDEGKEQRKENSNFGGPHYVECYIIKDNVCVARDRIDVPISLG